MPTSLSAASNRRTVRVHAAERSTDEELLRPYLGAIALIVVAAAVLAAAWVAAAPGAVADLPTAATAAGPVAPVDAVRTPASTDDVVQPDPFARPATATASTAVAVVPDATDEAASALG
jgi:hypothetical protein